MDYQRPMGGYPLGDEASRALARDLGQAAGDHYPVVPQLQICAQARARHATRLGVACRTGTVMGGAVMGGAGRIAPGARRIASRTARLWMRTEYYFIVGLMMLAIVGAGLELLAQRD